MWHEPWLSRLEHSILGEVSTSDRRRLHHSQKEKEGKEYPSHNRPNILWIIFVANGFLYAGRHATQHT